MKEVKQEGSLAPEIASHWCKQTENIAKKGNFKDLGRVTT